MSFPSDFAWGAATASYQVEGAAYEDGRGLSVWDMFCRKEGAVFSGQTGDVACDHYHRYRDDVAMMKWMGLKAYRLSISWPRVLPDGMGRVNEKGLAFYDRLIDALLDAGITPFVTLFHWDYPYELYCRGGWLNTESPTWFADYARVIAQRLGDRVRHWITLNEPQCFLGLGHRDGTHAPGLKLAWMDVLRAVHHSLLAHGRAVQVLREHCRQTPVIGWAPVGVVSYPGSDDSADVEAARANMFSMKKDLWNNTLFGDPVFLGHYPEESLRLWGPDFPKVSVDELRTINQKLDFYGMNIYQGQATRAGEDGKPVATERAPGHPITAYYWPVEPPSVYWGPKFIQERYRVPVYITENGLSLSDWVCSDGRVHDPQRIDYTRLHLREIGRAIDDGVDIRGYFHWSVMDNFEWAEGFRQRFGMVHVDFKTQRRTPKDSADWYGRVIRSNGREL